MERRLSFKKVKIDKTNAGEEVSCREDQGVVEGVWQHSKRLKMKT